MLKTLFISNYAIIDELTIDFSHNLNIITGETGAGKSILLGALELVTGKRADTSVLHDQDRKCVIEAYFYLRGDELKSLFAKNDLDYDQDLIVRREINPKGRSRAFVNDTPVNLKILSALTERLINIHRQFGAQDTFERSFQTMVLDAMADQLTLARTYRADYLALQSKLRNLEQLNSAIREGFREEEFLRFQLQEIEDFNPDLISDIKMEEQIQRIEHTEEIHNNLQHCAFTLYEQDQSIITRLRQLNTELSNISSYGKAFEDLDKRMQSVISELEDIASEASQLGEEGSYDPEEIESLKNRYDALQRLLFKHQLHDLHQLVDLKARIEEQLSRRTNQTEVQKELEIEIQTLQSKLELQATQLSIGRKKSLQQFEHKLKALLSELAMKNSQFEVNMEPTQELNPYGKELISFLFSANPGVPVQPLKDVASGGEMSRLTLCIQTMVAGKFSLPTLIFDEIDSGVSGDTAKRMGSMLSSVGQKHQLIVITHTPQVAASGDFHYFVEKLVRDKRTSTMIRKLNDQERIEKIGIMLSSIPPTETAISMAMELLKTK